MSLSRKTREKVNDYVVWWNFHSDKVAAYPLEKQVAWLMKALESQNEVLVEVIREIDNQPEARIMLPRGHSFGKRA